MGKLWVAVFAGAGGFALGLYVAKKAYESKVTDAIHQGLNQVGLAGGTVESIADRLVLGN